MGAAKQTVERRAKVNQAWEKVEGALRGEGITATNTKMKMGNHSLFVEVGWHGGRPVKIDIVLSRLSRLKRGNDTAKEFDLRCRITENARAMLDVICRHASVLLQSDTWNLDNIIWAWTGVVFDPKGECDGLKPDPFTESGKQFASSALDAARRLIEEKRPKWEERMKAEQMNDYTEEQIEIMIEACLMQMEEDPDEFSAFERTFLEDIEVVNEERHLTRTAINGGKSQVQVLEEIYEEHCGG